MKFAWLCSHESYQPEVLVDQAVRAEETGFDMILGSDHFHPWVDDNCASGFVWSWLGAVAARTDAELATSVTCPLYHYHPALVAQAAATVDRLSGGKFVLGVGTGENINEGPMGFKFGDYRERIRRMREALEIMHRLLEGEKLDFEGDWYTIDKARLYSPPPRKTPIWMAAGGPPIGHLRRTAGRRPDRQCERSGRGNGESHRAFPGLGGKMGTFGDTDDHPLVCAGRRRIASLGGPWAACAGYGRREDCRRWTRWCCASGPTPWIAPRFSASTRWPPPWRT